MRIAKKLIVALVFTFGLLHGDEAHAQFYQWAKGIGADGREDVCSVIPNGGYLYISGTFSKTVDFDPGPGEFKLTSMGGTDIFVAKYTQAGDFVWVKQVTGLKNEAANSSAMDSLGNVYTIGFFSGNCDFDPGPGENIRTDPTGRGRAFLWKLNKDGDLVWVRDYGGQGAVWAMSVAVGPDHCLYSIGRFSDSVDFDPGAGTFQLKSNGGLFDTFISKLDEGGAFVWAKSIGGLGSDWGISIKIDKKGNVYGAGSYEKTVDFDPSTTGTEIRSSNGTLDAYILSLDHNGNFRSVITFGGVSYEGVSDFTFDSAGNILAGGEFEGRTDFDPGPGVYELTSNSSQFLADAYVLKLDSTGSFIWARSFQADSEAKVYRIITDSQNSVYTVGEFRQSADFDPGTGEYILNSHGGLDGFISKLDFRGVFVWAKQIGGPSIDNFPVDDAVTAIGLNSDGSFVISGTFVDSCDFDPPQQEKLFSHGGSDVFIAKYSQGVVDVPEQESISISCLPQPAENVVVVSNIPASAKRVTMTSLIGQIVWQSNAACSSSLKIDVSQMSPGIYNLTILTMHESLSYPIRIVR